MKQFNFRIGNIEARVTHQRETMEVVQWGDSSCWVIASFAQSGDPLQWKAIFCGMRPLDSLVNWKHLRQLIEACYNFLNEGDNYESQQEE